MPKRPRSRHQHRLPRRREHADVADPGPQARAGIAAEQAFGDEVGRGVDLGVRAEQRPQRSMTCRVRAGRGVEEEVARRARRGERPAAGRRAADARRCPATAR